ncbi:uncharacterized protein ARMOST_21605 [Armillaria ostoyae]|uniref:Uncharacterized protein n=1 Tax=Armillaria ostoyae TaxID=47428 RepID=A0A284SAJ9_ARMOS|nr:uncharacterized protein ARMOST_21605 [Armillaria ostoyae]
MLPAVIQLLHVWSCATERLSRCTPTPLETEPPTLTQLLIKQASWWRIRSCLCTSTGMITVHSSTSLNWKIYQARCKGRSSSFPTINEFVPTVFIINCLSVCVFPAYHRITESYPAPAKDTTPGIHRDIFFIGYL